MASAGTCYPQRSAASFDPLVVETAELVCDGIREVERSQRLHLVRTVPTFWRPKCLKVV